MHIYISIPSHLLKTGNEKNLPECYFCCFCFSLWQHQTYAQYYEAC